MYIGYIVFYSYTNSFEIYSEINGEYSVHKFISDELSFEPVTEKLSRNKCMWWYGIDWYARSGIWCDLIDI